MFSTSFFLRRCISPTSSPSLTYFQRSSIHSLSLAQPRVIFSASDSSEELYHGNLPFYSQSLAPNHFTSTSVVATRRHPLGWMDATATAAPHEVKSTTILTVRKDGKVVMVGDGQVSMGSTIIKPNAKKVRRLKDDIIAGFAGTTADALTLLERLEMKLEEHPGQLLRSCVELAKSWRTDKYLRTLEALICVSDKDISLTLTGNGDVLEPSDGLIGIGSGGAYALACARGLIDIPGLDAETIALKAMKVASGICVYTNSNFTTEILLTNSPSSPPSSSLSSSPSASSLSTN